MLPTRASIKIQDRLSNSFPRLSARAATVHGAPPEMLRRRRGGELAALAQAGEAAGVWCGGRQLGLGTSENASRQERSSLLQFVSELSQDGSLRSSWEVTTDCCKWEGINCGPDKTLSHNQFDGSIPRELGNCSKLTSLNAGHNNLSGTLPNELFNLAFLEHLSLPSNQLEGSLSNMSKLSNLVTIDLGVNVISGSILDSIGELKGLQELHLDYNNISGELPSTLGNCTDLRSINLMSNNFSGGLTKLNFSTLTNLKTLDLAWNNFSGTIPESIYSCSSLNALRLSANKFNGRNNFTGLIPDKIGQLKTLVSLNLGSNKLTGEIPQSICNLTNLQLASNSGIFPDLEFLELEAFGKKKLERS
nr:unnamed protein product [Digitaria exilis]